MDPVDVLAGIRRDLRDVVLPAVEDDYARSVVVAMMGILRALPARIAADERWCVGSVAELQAGCARWADALHGDVARRVGELGDRAAALASPEAARDLLLGAACEVLAEVWKPGDAGPDAALLRDVRGVLDADLSRQLSAREARADR